MTAAVVSPQLPGWAEPVGIRPRPRSGRLRHFGALVVLSLGAGLAGPLSVAAAPSTPAAPPAGYPSLLSRPVDGKCWYTDTWQDPRPGGRFHEGIDIGADAGTPIFAVADGIIAKQYVDKPGWRGGNAIRLTMADGTYFFYGHMSSFAAGIAPGVPVTGGTVIGYVGMTGNAGVNHLHFEVHPQGGKPLNPYPLARAYSFCQEVGRAQPTPATTVAPAPAEESATSLQGALPTDPAASTPGAPGEPVVPALVLEPMPAGTPECVARYSVKSGDYWYFIAAAAKVRPSRLASANKRTIDSFIYPDEKLCIPDPAWNPTGAAPAPVKQPGSQPTGSTPPATPKGSAASPRPKGPTSTKCSAKYIVHGGDYWYMLATWFQVRVATLATANGRTIDDPIYPGESLCIPG